MTDRKSFIWKNRILWLAILAGLAILYLLTSTYGTLTILLAVLALIILSVILMRIPSGKIGIHLEAQHQIERGDTAVVWITANNRHIVPVCLLEVELEIRNRLTLGTCTRCYQLPVNGKSSFTYELNLEGCYTGCVEIRVAGAKVYDLLRIASRQIKCEDETETKVYPEIGLSEEILELKMVAVEESNRYSQDKTGNDISEIFALREYRPGDNIRKIHWKLSEKMDQTCVREFSMPINAYLVLMPELAQESEADIENCLKTALSYSRTLAENGIAHNLVWYDGRQDTICSREIFEPEDYEQAVSECLEAGGYLDSGMALYAYRELGYLSGNKLVLYITAQETSTLYEEIALQQPIQVIYPES